MAVEVIIMMGSPGAGKGTQSKKLADHLGFSHVSTGKIFREIISGERTSAFQSKVNKHVKKGKLVPDSLVIGVIEEELEKNINGKGIILDGFPRTLHQAKMLDRFLEKEGEAIDMVFKLEVSKEVARKRILSRGRKDDEQKKFKKRFNEYLEKTKPIFSYYREKEKLVEINGEQSPSQVFDDIVSAIKAKKRRE